MRVLVNGRTYKSVQTIIASTVSYGVTSMSRGCFYSSEEDDYILFVATCDTVHVPISSRCLRSSQPATQISSLTILGDFNAIPILPATNLITRVPIEAGVRASFQ